MRRSHAWTQGLGEASGLRAHRLEARYGERAVTRGDRADKELIKLSMYAVVNPATGEKLEEYPEISDDGLEAAIARAWEAHEALTSLAAAERAEKIKRLGELHL